MARTAIFSDEGKTNNTTLQEDTRTSMVTSERGVDVSPTPSISFSSDKENRPNAGARQKSMAPPNRTLTETPARSSRKRKLADREAPIDPTQSRRQEALAKVTDKTQYDPEQSLEERREIRKDYRELYKGLTDSRNELLASERGLMDYVERSNVLYKSVKQTSDATLDSRFLVSAADMSMKRTTQLSLGDGSAGVDVDDFVSKCITYMRKPQRRRIGDDSDNEDNPGYDEGDAFDWEHLGRNVCLPHSLRPSVPGFLLGPLSVQKRVRKVTQRRATQRRDPRDAVRPEELKELDPEQQQRSDLKGICEGVKKLLVKHANESASMVEEEATDEMPEDEIAELMRKYRIADNGGVPLFDFVVNPRSFGQTVENLFYVSFLVREGAVAVGSDGSGLPTLSPTTARTSEEQAAQNVQKHQAVFHLDFETWDEIINLFDIKGSIIPHRDPDPSARAGGRSWYG